ncbi:MAG: endonuclease Q family protein, partial [Candidatus Omnitrophica bacterium]|nr:endonuclease Q family protein [Candidatus Omnitrophota bacterium]
AMNWRLSKLDEFSLVSNSDSHSPSRIGREANVFNCELNYWEIKKVLETKDKEKFLYTVEFFPEEGRYHYDGHRNCDIRLTPQETKGHNGLCPECGRPVTKGVLYRVDELADRPEGFIPPNAIGYKSLVPLDEIISEVKGVGKQSKAVLKEYLDSVYALGSEFNIMVKVSEKELFSRLPERIAQGVKKVREKKLKILPGYDGEYGVIKIFNEEEEKKDEQLTLF